MNAAKLETFWNIWKHFPMLRKDHITIGIGILHVQNADCFIFIAFLTSLNLCTFSFDSADAWQEIAMLREQLRLRNGHIQQQRQELDEKVPGSSLRIGRSGPSERYPTTPNSFLRWRRLRIYTYLHRFKGSPWWSMMLAVDFPTCKTCQKVTLPRTCLFARKHLSRVLPSPTAWPLASNASLGTSETWFLKVDLLWTCSSVWSSLTSVSILDLVGAVNVYHHHFWILPVYYFCPRREDDEDRVASLSEEAADDFLQAPGDKINWRALEAWQRKRV